MTRAQVLAAINAPVRVNGTGGFTGVGSTVGGAPAAITIQAAGLNGGVAVTVGTIVSTDTAAQVATKINAALAGATGGADGIAASVVGGQLVMSSALADTVTLAGDNATLTAIGFAAGNRVTTVGALPPGMQAATYDGTNHLVLQSTTSDTAIDITSTSPDLMAELGLAVGTTDPTNLLTQSAVAQGQTLTIKIGANPPLTITFGTGVGQVSTLAELQTALGALTGGTATVNTANGNITSRANSLTDTIAVTGTATPLNFGMHTLDRAAVQPAGARPAT